MTGMEGQSNGFTERFAKSAEARIEADKLRNVHDNAVDLVKNNVDFFGGYNDEKKSEIALRVLGRFGRGYKDVETIINDTNNTSKNQRIAHGDLDSLAESVKIAMDISVLGKDLVTDSMTAEQIDENLSIEFKGIGKIIKEKRLLDNIKNTLVEKNKVIEDGNLFTTQDKVVRSEVYKKWGEEVKTLPENPYVRKYVEVARSVFEDLGVEKIGNNQTENVEDDNSRIEANESLLEMLKKIGLGVDVPPDEVMPEVNPAALMENQHAKDPNKEYRSPYEVTPESFVDALFNQDSPRLYFTPAPEWVRKLSSTEQYLLKIEQKLANGAATKLAVKDISADKARQNEVYNFPETELKLIYEMPGVKEAMETFTSELFEQYEEDGRKFLRLKQCKIENYNKFPLKSNEKRSDFGIDSQGYVRKIKDGSYVLDSKVARNLGDIGADSSFEDYKEEMFKKMALRKLYPSRINDINNNWKLVYDEKINDYRKECRLEFKDDKRNSKRTDNRTDAELETQWITNNALEEKKAVATAWNFLFVGNIIESADITRSLKPSQINSDKIRTMMMPLEKFLQKTSIRKGKLQGSEELFGGSIALWAKRRLEDEGTAFSDKLVYAADNDRNKMTDEQAQWRLFPKRTMCSFTDEYHVKTEDGQDMPMSEALLNKKKIVFEKNDLDVFVSLRDTWDEVISVSPFIIGKGEYSPIQQGEKFSSAVEKLKGLVTGINKIRLTPEEASKQGKAFGHEKFVDCPEFYAWLIANSVGLEMNLDIPILNRTTMKADGDTYNDHVNNLVRLLNLDPGISLRTKEILNGKNWLSAKTAIIVAERKASTRENMRRLEEKRKRS